ncbi:restriction endonuclease subunit S [Tenacibaculum finnmarkense]|uniref:restriction endonuclease subunit S n=1 Tax=Tenacibaculum finnmarkense TaxID=2781243 RepID=UPI001E3FE6B3|nr:restriction endonuclease subunit S [Tenacibaculum finnmarkense]MCD8399909.1 restriction endonuclease subunit S [Tenacibaculum finnmarkense genomovar ulcerans]
MEKYKKYKNSGIDWLGEIPEHWNNSHLKRICKLIKDGTHASFKRVDKDGFPLLSVRNIVNNQFINLKDDSLISKEDYLSIVKSFKICQGDIQLAIVGATMGKVAIVPKLPPFATQRSVATIRVNDRYLFNRYLFYFIQGVKFQGYLWNNTNYSAQPGIYLGTIQTTSVFIPPLKEQTEIANYLDAKTQTIDKKVKLLSEKISTYKDYRKTLINQTVTKGLDKNVKLKNSGINWIGEIPKHWEVKRFKSFGKTIKGKNMEMSDLKFDNSLPLLSLEYLRNDSVQHPTFCYSNDKSLKSTNEDLIIVWDGAAVGEILKSKVGYVSSTIAKLEINKKKFNTRYFYHLRGAIDYKLKQIPTGMGIPHLNPTLFKNFKCPTPPLKEQQAIANYLDDKTQTIDTIIKNIENQITTLKELRKTLINEVVTGKVKITG